jgi:hypothetical protein
MERILWIFVTLGLLAIFARRDYVRQHELTAARDALTIARDSLAAQIRATTNMLEARRALNARHLENDSARTAEMKQKKARLEVEAIRTPDYEARRTIEAALALYEEEAAAHAETKNTLAMTNETLRIAQEQLRLIPPKQEQLLLPARVAIERAMPPWYERVLPKPFIGAGVAVTAAGTFSPGIVLGLGWSF